jgi:outer membrane protein OmpA-like peptidoglycan-associated protein
VSAVEARLLQTDGKAEKALANLDQLQLERRFVLELKDGANFAPNSTVLSDQARRAIDSFLATLKGTGDSLFLVAGHTDNAGPDEYNYELGQKRATSVVRYLITQKRIDPLQVAAVSYGENVPLSNNVTAEGRRKNRRIEILVYKEAITTASTGRQHLDLRRSSQSAPSP